MYQRNRANNFGHTKAGDKTSKRNYGGKGRTLERSFERAIKQLNRIPKVIAIRLEVKRIGADIYKEKQPCDYIIITPICTWLIDAKECAGDVWYPSKAPAHQIEYFKKAQAMHHRAGFVVWFKKFGATRFVEGFDKPIRPHDCIGWDWNLVIQETNV